MDKMSYSQIEGILYNYKLIKASIENNKIKLENLELEEQEDGVSAITYGEPGSKTNKFNSATENAAIKNIERKERLKRSIKKTIRRETTQIKMIDNALKALPETERKIIEMFYIEGNQWRNVAFEINYSVRQCINLRNEAMGNIMLTINGKNIKESEK